MLGLKNSLKEKIVAPFWNYRGNENRGGIPITFAKFMATRPDGGEVIKNSAGQPIGLIDLFIDMGMSPHSLYLNNLASRDDDFKYLFGPLIEDIFIEGFTGTPDNQPAMWMQLCFATGVPAAQEGIKRTKLTYSAEPAATGEGEHFPEALITRGEEEIAWKKKGITLRLSVEYLRANPLPVVADYIREVGRVYQHMENQSAVSCLVNGDLSNGNNACPVIGVDDTAKGVQYLDFVTVWTRGALIGERWFAMVCGEVMSNTVGMIDEFKKREAGTTTVTLVNRPEPAQASRFVSSEVADGQVMLVDTSHAMRQRVFIPINVMQSDKPENWTQGVTVGYSTTFERLADKACVAMDGTKDIDSNAFPAWFAVGKSRP